MEKNILGQIVKKICGGNIRMKEKYISLIDLLTILDWSKILYHAVNKGIFTSAWNKNAVREWRNAGDSIYLAVLNELEEIGIDTVESKVIIVELKKKGGKVKNG